jgi:hypothetical protein
MLTKTCLTLGASVLASHLIRVAEEGTDESGRLAGLAQDAMHQDGWTRMDGATCSMEHMMSKYLNKGL